MRIGPGLSAERRAHSCGRTCRVNAFRALEWRKNPVFVLTSPSSKDGRLEGSCSEERRRSSKAVDESKSWASINSATRAASALLGQSSTTPVWRSISRRSSEISCSKIVLVVISLCIEPFPLRSAFLGENRFSTSGGCPNHSNLAGIAFCLPCHHIHLFFQGRKTLHHLVDAQGHVANGFDLAARLGRQSTGLDQQQIGVDQQC